MYDKPHFSIHWLNIAHDLLLVRDFDHYSKQLRSSLLLIISSNHLHGHQSLILKLCLLYNTLLFQQVNNLFAHLTAPLLRLLHHNPYFCILGRPF